MISATGACHGPMPYRFHDDRLPFGRIDENQEQECANCDIIHLMMSSSGSLALSHSASSILSTSSSRSIKPPPPPLIETDDSASASSSADAAPAPAWPALTIHEELHRRYLLLSSTSIQQPLGFGESLLQMTRHAPTKKIFTPHIETDDSASSSSSAVAAPVLTIHEKQQRRSLLGLYHGATCCRSYSLQYGGACPDHVRCAAVKRFYSHILHCRSKKECIVPGCIKARKLWAHFGRCIDQDCHICTVIPNRSEEKLSLSKKYKKKTTTTATKKPAAANTSSSKTAAFQMSSLVAAIAASMPSVPMHDEGRPPLSPTRSFTAPFYCYI